MVWQDLTLNQRKIYDLYFNQGLTQKAIAHRLQISQQAISKTIKKINKKTVVTKESTGGCIKGGRVVKRGLYKLWRFHGLHFMIKPYYFYPRYHRVQQERGNYGISFDQFTIILYPDSVRVQSKHDISWSDPDKFKAISSGEHDFNDFLEFAAQKFGFEYKKNGRISIKLISSELAFQDSDFAKQYNEKTGENTLIVRDYDGKVCFLIDKSKGDLEHEYIGRQTIPNSERLEPYIQDMLFNDPLTNSQLTMRISDMLTALEKQKDINDIILRKLGGFELK